ncbi:MAG: elongation factor P [Candidatus Marinimicrobia bacterium]|jgi:elongation factor P|nr:elongation factor P [Candidatus Neomarinimicrobiota bacterium]
MADTSDFRNGMVIKYKNDLYKIIDFLHVKPGKGGAFVRTTLKNIFTGQQIENTFRAGEKVEEVRIVAQQMQYLYTENDLYYFMNNDTYEQIPVPKEVLGDNLQFLKENQQVKLLFNEDRPIDSEMPIHVELEITKTDPGLRGDTATGGSKPATVETGYSVQVPLFINEGDIIKIDTRNGEYVERVNT